MNVKFQEKKERDADLKVKASEFLKTKITKIQHLSVLFVPFEERGAAVEKE